MSTAIQKLLKEYGCETINELPFTVWEEYGHLMMEEYNESRTRKMPKL